MKKIGLIFTFILLAFTSFSQHVITPQKPVRYPRFSSPEDSTQFVIISNIFNKMRFRNLEETSKDYMDSLWQAYDKLFKKVVAYETAYLPHTDFTRWDSVKKKNLYDTVSLISFTSEKMTEFPAELWKCTNVEAIELFETSLSELPEELNQLPNLHTILINNNSKKIRITKDSRIKTLIVRGNTSENFKRLTNLEKLDVSDCDLTRFPKGLHKSKKLKEVMLNDNQINLAKRKIRKRNSITHLEMQANNMTVLPSSIKRFTNLKTLVLNGNLISEVSPAIAQLKKLEQLAFYKNQLTAIPSGVYELPALREIDLYYNLIGRVDERIQNLKNLEVLYLSYNGITSVAESIGTLPKLQELYLSNNQLADLPASISNLEQLRVLRINNNHLTQVPNDLHRLINIENLDFSGNKISEAPQGIGSLSHLKLLVIMNNPWNQSSIQSLTSLAQDLRNKNVIVHFEQAVESEQ